MPRYRISVLRVINRETGRQTFYKYVCDHPRRISRHEYCEIKEKADSFECLHELASCKHYKRVHTDCIYERGDW